jgi:DNA-binding response OmpR family regulator
MLAREQDADQRDLVERRADRLLNEPIGSELLLLDVGERRFRGVEMPPLLGGEFKLLMFLGCHSSQWHSSYALSVQVYGRQDARARQLVWTYASTLRSKLAIGLPTLIETCRKRGYRCRHPIVVVGNDMSCHR